MKNDKLRATLVDFYEDYISEPRDNEIDKKTYKKICSAFNTILAAYIIETGNYIKLPYNLGLMGIGKKQRKTRFNYQGLDDSNNPIKHSLKHSDGWAAKIRWVKQRKYGRVFKFTDIWNFRFSRKIRKALSVAILEKNNIKKYYPYD